MTPSDREMLTEAFVMWPEWLCALLTFHCRFRKWTHSASDGSCADLFPDGEFCMCGKRIRRLR